MAGYTPTHPTVTTWTTTAGGVRVRECVRVMCKLAIYDNDIGPRLIMVIIKIIILYFIQITHTDDFPSTGTRLVPIIREGHISDKL